MARAAVVSGLWLLLVAPHSWAIGLGAKPTDAQADIAHAQQSGRGVGSFHTDNSTAASWPFARNPLVAETPMPRLAIVSSSYGGRGYSEKLVRLPQGVRGVLYTDRAVTNPNGWFVVTSPYHEHTDEVMPWLNSHGRHSRENLSRQVRGVGNVMRAKFYKLNAHLLPEVEGVELVFWIDADRMGEVQLAGSLYERAVQLLAGKDMAVEAHPERVTVKAEMRPAAGRAQQSTKYKHAWRDMEDAWNHQVHEGFLDKSGLFYCSHFVIRTESLKVRSAFQAWWAEIQNYTFRDQISFPWIVQKFQLPLTRLNFRTMNRVYRGECHSTNFAFMQACLGKMLWHGAGGGEVAPPRQHMLG